MRFQLLIVFAVLVLPGRVGAEVCFVAPPIVAQSSSFYAGPVVALRLVTVAAYYPPPVVVRSVPVFDCQVPGRPVPQAIPAAAPASSLARRSPELAPTVSEFHETPRMARSLTSPTSFYRAYYSGPSGTARGDDQIQVTLTNASGKAALVWLNGVRYVLSDGQKLQREVTRDFTWQVEGRDRETVRAPAGQQGMSIVIER